MKLLILNLKLKYFTWCLSNIIKARHKIKAEIAKSSGCAREFYEQDLKEVEFDRRRVLEIIKELNSEIIKESVKKAFGR